MRLLALGGLRSTKMTQKAKQKYSEMNYIIRDPMTGRFRGKFTGFSDHINYLLKIIVRALKN
jgi:hypothetical protein